MTSFMDTATLIQTAKLIAVPLPLILSGYSFSSSQNSVPHLYDQKAEITAPVFKKIYYGGASVMVPGGILSLTATTYLAYAVPSERYTWATAAGSLLAFSLWTPVVMLPSTINRLLEISGSSKLQEKASANLEARQLLTKWVAQNYVRAALLFFAGVAGLRATIAA